MTRVQFPDSYGTGSKQTIAQLCTDEPIEQAPLLLNQYSGVGASRLAFGHLNYP